MQTGYFKKIKEQTATRLWINNPTIGDVRHGLEAGAIHCTTNPTYAARMLREAESRDFALGVIDTVLAAIDTFEASIGLTYKWLTYTFYYIPTNYYGAAASGTRNGKKDTDGATYNELKFNYTLPVASLNLLAKVGYQHTPNLLGSQGDVAIGLSRNFSIPSAGKPIEGFSAGAYYTDTFHVKDEAYYVTADGRDVNQETVWFFVKRAW